jgi:hypothetical protein
MMNANSEGLVADIENWFRQHEDGEFSIVPQEVPSVCVGDRSAACTLVYTTKQHCLSRIELGELVQPVAILGRYGLPRRGDLDWLCGGNVCRLFLGDADPPDLLVFAWLREHVSIQWAGVSDEFFNARGYDRDPTIQIQLADSELAAVTQLVRLCPDYHELLGEFTSSLLDRGAKIELEGALAH